jgi:hypothetical protein
MKKIYSHLMMLAMMLAAMTTFTSCEEEDDYIAQQLRGCDWQGYIDAYYQNRWNLQGSTYETVMRFESRGNYYTSGRGYEADYDVNSPYQDYAYCTFKWFIVDGEITLIYDDSRWNPIYISDYYLNSNSFRGYINDGSGRRIKFNLQSATGYDGWSRYDRTGSYGDFWDQQYYRARTRAAEGDQHPIPFVDRTEQARQESGQQDARSLASGVFAEAIASN